MKYIQNNIFMKISWKIKKEYEYCFVELMDKWNLTQGEIDVLLFLYNNKELNKASDIAKYRSISKSMVSKSIDILRKKKYISFELDKEDKRCIRLKLADVSIPIVKDLRKIQKSFFEKLTMDISDEEHEAILNILKKIEKNIELKE